MINYLTVLSFVYSFNKHSLRSGQGLDIVQSVYMEMKALILTSVSQSLSSARVKYVNNLQQNHHDEEDLQDRHARLRANRRSNTLNRGNGMCQGKEEGGSIQNEGVPRTEVVEAHGGAS